MTIEEALLSGKKICILWGYRDQVQKFRQRYTMFHRQGTFLNFVVGVHELYGFAPDKMILICLPDWDSHYSQKVQDMVILLSEAEFTIINATDSDL